MSWSGRLTELGLVLPPVAAPAGVYLPAVRSGALVFTAGQLPLVDWLFGTLHLPAHRWPEGYGIDDTQPDGYLRQLAWPFRSTAPAGSGQSPPPVLDHRQAV